MAMEMEKLSITIIHPIVGSTHNLKGLIDIARNFVEEKTAWSPRSVEGLRIVKKFQDPNCDLEITTLRGSELDYALSRALLYPKAKGSATWLDERIDNQYKGGTGVLESIDQQSDKSTDDNSVYMLKITNYKGS